MPYRFTWNEELGLWEGLGTGVLTDADVSAGIDLAVAESKGAILRSHILMKIDRHASLSDLDLPALERIKARLTAHFAAYPPAPGQRPKTAFVVPARLHQAVILLWKAVLATEPDPGRNIRLFEREADALAWLRE